VDQVYVTKASDMSLADVMSTQLRIHWTEEARSAPPQKLQKKMNQRMEESMI